jgi:choline transport protein
MFCMVDVTAAINDKTEYPFLFVFKRALDLATVDVSIVVLVLVFAGTLSYSLSSSRQMFAVSQSW